MSGDEKKKIIDLIHSSLGSALQRLKEKLDLMNLESDIVIDAIYHHKGKYISVCVDEE